MYIILVTFQFICTKISKQTRQGHICASYKISGVNFSYMLVISTNFKVLNQCVYIQNLSLIWCMVCHSSHYLICAHSHDLALCLFVTSLRRFVYTYKGSQHFSESLFNIAQLNLWKDRSLILNFLYHITTRKTLSMH